MPSRLAPLKFDTMSRCQRPSTHFGDTSSPIPSPLHPQGPAEVYPRLYVGDLAAAEDPATLAALGITHVVSVLPDPIHLPPPNKLLYLRGAPLEHHLVPVHDHPFEDLFRHLAYTTQWIESALSADPRARVLVHCAQGVSRSATVAAAFLIEHEHVHPEEAIARVRARRPCAEPNTGFIGQLYEYAETRGIQGCSKADRGAVMAR